MNKNFLLLIVVACLMVLSAGAQSRKSDAARSLQRPSLSRVNPQVDASVQEMQERSPVAAPARDNAPLKPFYRRPAGAFYCSQVAINGVGGYMLNHDFALLKPYAEYAFYGYVQNADGNTDVAWDAYRAPDYVEAVDHEWVLKMAYDMSIEPMPIFYATDGPLDDPQSNWYSYQMPYYSRQSGGFVEDVRYAQAWAVPNPDVVFTNEDESVDFLLSSKTTCMGGRNNDLNYTWIKYYSNGAFPFVYDPSGNEFGKNTKHIDGMAQAFERPEHPYLLKKVYWEIGSIVCSAPVSLTCKVYRLEGIPPYKDEGCVVLPEAPGELIAIGEGIVDQMTEEEKFGLVEFELFGFDEDDPELIYEMDPTIDYPILVVIEGYNDPTAADLVDFSALICADFHEDEGYGELAYLKTPVNDEDGNFTGEYEWTGLNHYIRDSEMKTALSIFIVADQPFITFNYNDEDGEYVFPPEGGLMEKHFGDSTTRSIEFYSLTPSADNGWTVTCRGEEIPEWLDIELIDGEKFGKFNDLITAKVVAEPIPEGVSYREAVVRFEIPGAYINYKFIQDGGHLPNPCIDEDGELNIGDLNYLIHLILSEMYDNCYDVNEDGELGLADINALIDLIIWE